MKAIIDGIFLIGLGIGKLWAMIDTKGDYLWYVFRRAIVTGKYKNRFKSFGLGSKLAPGLCLLNPQYIHVGLNVSIMSHCVLECSPHSGLNPEMILGNNISIGEYSHITCARRIAIGDGLLTGRFVLITDNGHGQNSAKELETNPLLRQISSPGPVIIGNNVWIGDKVTILPNVTIGDGAVIAANTVVTKDIPPYCIAAGCPAKAVKTIK